MSMQWNAIRRIDFQSLRSIAGEISIFSCSKPAQMLTSTRFIADQTFSDFEKVLSPVDEMAFDDGSLRDAILRLKDAPGSVSICPPWSPRDRVSLPDTESLDCIFQSLGCAATRAMLAGCTVCSAVTIPCGSLLVLSKLGPRYIFLCRGRGCTQAVLSILVSGLTTGTSRICGDPALLGTLAQSAIRWSSS